jgi:hypothetical protein
MSLQYRGRIFAKTSAICCARLEDRATAYASNGTAFKQANFSTISYSVFDPTTEQPVSNNGVNYQNLPLTISAVIFDTLQGWAEDSLGCNFILTVGPGAFPQNDIEYRVEVEFTLTDGRQGFAVFLPTTEKVLTS